MPDARPRTKIDEVVTRLPDGTAVTVADRLLQVIREGGYVEYAAAYAEISKVTFYKWVREGTAALKAIERDPTAELDDHARQCLELVNAVDRANGEFVAGSLARLGQVARGGRTSTSITTRRDGAGTILETVERVEVAPPNPAIDMWRLERRFPASYGRRALELSGPGGEPIPVEVRARELADNLRAARKATTPPRKPRARRKAPVVVDG